MIVAASVALGRKNSSGVRNSAASAMPTAVNAPGGGRFGPGVEVHDRAREAARSPDSRPRTAAAMLAAPSPISSWSGSMRWRFLAASVCATETDSTKPMIEISSAGPIRLRQSIQVERRQRQRRQPAAAPRRRSRRRGPASPKPKVSSVVTTTAATGPALASISASRGLSPAASSSGFSPLRTQNRNADRGRPRSAR